MPKRIIKPAASADPVTNQGDAPVPTDAPVTEETPVECPECGFMHTVGELRERGGRCRNCPAQIA